MAGTAAATLIGLLFVAVTVGAGFSKSSIVHGARGFLTPTLIRFGGVLFLSLAVLAPWPSARPIGIVLSLGGLAGLAYQIKVIVARHDVGLVLLDWHDWLPVTLQIIWRKTLHAIWRKPAPAVARRWRGGL
jgi:hypothetical protein